MAYDKNTDYQALINAELAKGAGADRKTLSAYEKARNEKIDALNTANSNNFTSFDGKSKYAAEKTNLYGFNNINPTRPELSGLGLGDMYGITYDMDVIKGILSEAVKKQYETQRQEFAQTENKFYNNLSAAQSATMDALRKSQAQAVATGASKGMAAANELSAMLGFQQQTTDESNQLANDRNNLVSKEAADMAKVSSDALEASNAIKQAIGQLDLTKYGYDTQGYIGELDYLAAIESTLAQKYAADKSFDAQKYATDGYKSNSYNNTNYNYGGGGGGGNYGTPTEKEASEITGPIDEAIKKDGNFHAKDKKGSNITITKNADGSYKVSGVLDSNGNSTDVTMSPQQFNKYSYNDYDYDAVANPNYGAFKDDREYTAPSNGMTRKEAEAYYFKNGKVPYGWQRKNKQTFGGVDFLEPKTYSNNVDTDGAHGTKISVGDGKYATTWTWDQDAGRWNASTGTSLNKAAFETYIKKQNPMYVKAIG